MNLCSKCFNNIKITALTYKTFLHIVGIFFSKRKKQLCLGTTDSVALPNPEVECLASLTNYLCRNIVYLHDTNINFRPCKKTLLIHSCENIQTIFKLESTTTSNDTNDKMHVLSFSGQLIPFPGHTQ